MSRIPKRFLAVLGLLSVLAVSGARAVFAETPAETSRIANVTRHVVASGTYTAAKDIDDVDLDNPGLRCVVDLSNNGDGTGGITPAIQGKDDISGKFYTVLTGPHMTTTSTAVMTARPGVVESTNVATSQPVPPRWRFHIPVDNSAALTYSVGCVYLP